MGVAETADGPEDSDAVPVVDSADLTDRDVLPDINDAPLDLDYETTFTSDGHDEAPIVADATEPLSSNWSTSTRGGDNSGGESIIERTAAETVGLRDHLLSQLNIAVVDPIDRFIGGNLIDLIDESGYLIENTDIIA
jgi:DNA-directed RNA polymerase specialized sigma54-like protein